MPADHALMSALLDAKPPGPLQVIEYGDVPPVMSASIAPLLAPPQLAEVMFAPRLSAAAGCEMLALPLVVHPLASVMVHVQLPAGRLFAIAPLVAGVEFQRNTYGAVPPLAFIVALPVALPKQPALVCAVTLLLRGAEGCVIVTALAVVQPIASEMVQVHAPAGRLLADVPA